MRKYLIILILSVSLPALSQSTNISTLFYSSIKKADLYFNHYAYRNALQLYLHAFEKNPENTYVMEQIAECYFKIHNPIEAEKWFRKVVEKRVFSKKTTFDFAEVLSMNGSYSEAKYWYEETLKNDPESQILKDKIKFIDNIQIYEIDSLEFLVSSVEFNTNHSEYGAHKFRDGLVFSSSRDISMFIKHRPFDAVDDQESLLNLFYVDGQKVGEFGSAELLHEEKSKAILHEGPIAFYDNDTKAAFTRTNLKGLKLEYDENKKAHLQIFFADINDARELKRIRPFQYNSNNFSIGHPSLTPNGKTMFFTSTAPGGFGGSDIYYSNNLGDSWTLPVNIGPNVNTPGDESFPFVANDSTLYFSSNGHGSLGGLDIMASYRRNGQFSKPENFGSPLNSRFDDFSFQSDGLLRSGFFASNRPGGKGLDDIYYFEVTDFYLKGHTLAENDTIAGVTIKVKDALTGELITSITSDSTGSYRIKLPFEKKYIIETEKDGLVSGGKTEISTFSKGLNMDLRSLRLQAASIHSKGKIYSKETQQPITDVLITVFNLTDNLKENIQVNNPDGYDLTLLRNKSYRIEFTKTDYVTQSIEINTTGLNAKELLNDIILEESFEKSMVINFDYKKSTLTAESQKALKPFAEILKKYPGYTVNIAAHADSRGTRERNLELSNLRAKSAKAFLIKSGISESRITWKGFGEALILNRCSDGVKCSDAEHLLNRRAELKIQK